jgi:mannose-6-phosphate isomerase-like protein (cupin superfamily)
MRKAPSVIAALVCAVAIAQTRTPTPKAPKDEDLLITSEQMDAILQNAVSKDTGKPAGISARQFDGGTYSASFIRLIAPDHPHAHGDWSEVFIVREGAGTLETGGALVCPCSADSAIHKDIFANPPAAQQPAAQPSKQGTPHDGAADAIEGGRKQKVKAGDIVLVPVGVPHTWVEIEKPVVYLDIKFH